jgi:hypothetical protein
MNSAPTRRYRLIFIYVLYVLLLKVDYRIACHRVALISAQAVGASANVSSETALHLRFRKRE